VLYLGVMIQEIYIPTYKTKIKVFNNKETLKRLYPKVKFNIVKESEAYSCKVGGEYLMYLSSQDVSLITHESLHISWYILSDRDIESTSASHEAQAYLLEYIVKSINELKWNKEKLIS